MTDHTPTPCGCRVTLTEAGTYLGAITYCPSHAAAPDLLAALKEIRDNLGVPNEDYAAPVAHAVDVARAAIAQAKKDA